MEIRNIEGPMSGEALIRRECFIFYYITILAGYPYILLYILYYIYIYYTTTQKQNKQPYLNTFNPLARFARSLHPTISQHLDTNST